MGTKAAGQLFELCDANIATVFDDVGCAELLRECLAFSVLTEGGDPLGSELLGGKDTWQSDGAVADDCHSLARTGLCCDGCEQPAPTSSGVP